MTIFICSGPVFADWKTHQARHLQTDSSRHPKSVELSALNSRICQDQWPQMEKAAWLPFSADQSYLDAAKQLLDSAQADSISTWADNDSCLLLDFWKKAHHDARFLLFYSSPEYELANYLKQNSYDAAEIKGSIENWVHRSRAMLTFFMKNRDSCLLLDVQTAAKHPRKLVRIINDAFDAGLTEPIDEDEQQLETCELHEYLAATLIINNDLVSETYDEIRSAATVIDDAISFQEIQTRAEVLIPAFLDKIEQHEQLEVDINHSPEELENISLQLYQTQKELECYYLRERDTSAFLENYLEFTNQKPFLRLARLARLNKNSK